MIFGRPGCRSRSKIAERYFLVLAGAPGDVILLRLMPAIITALTTNHDGRVLPPPTNASRRLYPPCRRGRLRLVVTGTTPGHKSIASTKRYAKLSTATLKALWTANASLARPKKTLTKDKFLIIWSLLLQGARFAS